MLLAQALDLPRSRRHCNGNFKIALNRYGAENPGRYGRE
jgi:hypothetical protein